MKGHQPHESGSTEHGPSSAREDTDHGAATSGASDDVETWDNEGGHDRTASEDQRPHTAPD